MPRVVLILLAGVGLILLGRCSAPRPVGPSRDSTRTMAARDTLLLVDSSLAGALRTAEGTIAWLRARKPPIVPPRPDSGGLSQPQTDTVYRRMAYDSVTIAVLGDTLAAVRDTLEAVRPRLDLVARELVRTANRLGTLERRRVYPWSAGAVFEGAAPVGGYIDRRLWRVQLGAEVTDGKDEPVTLRVKAGWTF